MIALQRGAGWLLAYAARSYSDGGDTDVPALLLQLGTSAYRGSAIPALPRVQVLRVAARGANGCVCRATDGRFLFPAYFARGAFGRDNVYVMAGAFVDVHRFQLMPTTRGDALALVVASATYYATSQGTAAPFATAPRLARHPIALALLRWLAERAARPSPHQSPPRETENGRCDDDDDDDDSSSNSSSSSSSSSGGGGGGGDEYSDCVGSDVWYLCTAKKDLQCSDAARAASDLHASTLVLSLRRANAFDAAAAAPAPLPRRAPSTPSDVMQTIVASLERKRAPRAPPPPPPPPPPQQQQRRLRPPGDKLGGNAANTMERQCDPALCARVRSACAGGRRKRRRLESSRVAATGGIDDRSQHAVVVTPTTAPTASSALRGVNVTSGAFSAVHSAQP